MTGSDTEWANSHEGFDPKPDDDNCVASLFAHRLDQSKGFHSLLVGPPLRMVWRPQPQRLEITPDVAGDSCQATGYDLGGEAFGLPGLEHRRSDLVDELDLPHVSGERASSLWDGCLRCDNRPETGAIGGREPVEIVQRIDLASGGHDRVLLSG